MATAETKGQIEVMPWIRNIIPNKKGVILGSALNRAGFREFHFLTGPTVESNGVGGTRTDRITVVTLYNVGHLRWLADDTPVITEAFTARHILMKLREQIHPGGNTEYAILISARDPLQPHFFRDVIYGPDGVKQVRLDGFSKYADSRQNRDPSLNDGVVHANLLPDRIDPEATREAFLDQARQLDFQNPRLFPSAA